MEPGDRVGRERALWRAVLAGDARAWQTWYDECFDSLYAYVSWRCGGLRDLADCRAPHRQFQTGGSSLRCLAGILLTCRTTACGGKKADMADPVVAERATGYVIVGISPLGGRRKLRTFLHTSALGHTTILVSAGRRGLQMELSPKDLLQLAGGATGDLAVER